jgi:hypothetical protein
VGYAERTGISSTLMREADPNRVTILVEGAGTM